jgi:predicted RNase H-like HicB family nuclease
MQLPITIEVVRKAKWYLARIPELDFVSQGRTLAEAKKNVIETLRIQLAEMREMGTLQEYLEECGYVRNRRKFVSQPEIVSFEKSLATV